MPIAAHLICRDHDGVKKVEGEASYTSGSWVIPRDVANQLVGGRLYLHETKKQCSYFGGQVTGFFESQRDEGAISAGVTFQLISDKGGKGKLWQGRDHGMAWFSDLVDEE